MVPPPALTGPAITGMRWPLKLLRHKVLAFTRAGLPPIGLAGAVHPLSGFDLSVSRPRSPRRVRGYRPHGALPARADAPVKPQVPLQKTPSATALTRLVTATNTVVAGAYTGRFQSGWAVLPLACEAA